MIFIFQKAAAILIGSLLLSIGINGFLIPHQLLDGGITGIALILHYYFDFPTGLAMFLLSIPLCIYAWIYERTFFYNSFLGLIVASIFIDWLEPLRNQFFLSIFPSMLIGGGLIGIGVGIMLRYEASTGGTDLLAQFISKAFSVNIGVVIFMIDGLIVTSALNTLELKAFLFSCLTICIIGMITSFMARPSNS
ncbi:YitT family protein [Peribacillus castrilensis]|uniref:Membrane protein n=4 Tax=Bacillaceae TaxID=186817 RepID=A0AAN2PIW7_9BACI|nr:MULTISPECIES: YitT family protein [Peribacillus]MCF7625434.1 YitT family protein [Peribacillus frigoritolerans]MCP1156182.1 YitT family protein [Peribacillus frigoritolerans]MCT1391947.1 YitT family protein [Peribacillus frigoritolerans]MEA3575364.1 YitT family protein [Peribacillus frigoritolerans]CEG33166.1 membrane protein [Peribacillus simplex]